MQGLIRKIESLHYLAVFEAAARTGSFTEAATEMNVTQPAVSRSIRRLEAAIGVPLFERKHRSIFLTETGKALADEVAACFGRLEKTVTKLSKDSGQASVTLSVSSVFAHFWLMPRLKTLMRSKINLDLRLQVTDREVDPQNLDRSLAIRRGQGDFSGYHAKLLARENMIAVVSKNFFDDYPRPESITDFAQLPLIYYDDPTGTNLIDWSIWFNHFSLAFEDTSAGLRLNDIGLVLRAALSGQGVALCYRHLVEDLLDRGDLIQVGDWEYNTGFGYYLLWTAQHQLDKHTAFLRDWLLKPENLALQATSLTIEQQNQPSNISTRGLRQPNIAMGS